MVKAANHKRPNLRMQSIISFVLVIVLIALVNFIGSKLYKRFDLTKEKRYSISQPTKDILKEVEDPIYVKVYLEGKFPPGFQRLRNATKDLLQEFRVYSSKNLSFEFIDPMAGDKEEQKAMFDELTGKGLEPTNLQDQQNDGTYSERIIFPGAIVSYKGREMTIPLLENQIGYGPEQALNHSIISLEYRFASTINKLAMTQRPKVGFLEGHGELSDMHLSGVANALNRMQYDVARFDLKSSYNIPAEYDVVVIAKPTQRLEEKEKYKIDQYVMNGGRVIWLMDAVNAEMDSLDMQNAFMAIGYEDVLNLQDILFKYGVRINYEVVQDALMNAPIPLQVGVQGGQPQFQPFNWMYYPLLTPANPHPIVKNLDPVMAQFANTIDIINPKDTAKAALQEKTVLLQTSEYSRAQMTPLRVHLASVTENPDPSMFKQPNLPVAVLIEGEFESIFQNRVASSFLQATDTVEDLKYKEKIDFNKMIVIADGDIISNEVRGGNAYPLGHYSYTGQNFANQEFILNCVEYLMDSEGLIESRTKEIKIRPLNRVRVNDERLQWQLINVIGPLVLLGIFGLLFNFMRKRSYR